MESGLLEVLQLCSKTRDTYLKNISLFKVGNRCIQLLWRSWAFYHPHKCINATDQYQLRNISLINIVEFIKGFHMLIRMIAIATPCLEVTQPWSIRHMQLSNNVIMQLQLPTLVENIDIRLEINVSMFHCTFLGLWEI